MQLFWFFTISANSVATLISAEAIECYQITSVTSYSTKTRFVYYPNGRYVPCYHHAPVAMMLLCNCLYSTFSHGEQFFYFSCCHWNGTIKSKLPTNCFRAKLYTVSNHILPLPSEPHMVKLLVKMIFRSCQDCHRISSNNWMTVCDSISENLF